MKGMFCFVKVCSNEEFKKILKKRCRVYLAFAVLGILTLGMALLAGEGILDDYRKGFLCGVGSGLFIGGALLFARIRRILKSEERVKKERLLCTDERELAISSQALKCGSFVTILALYGMILWGVFFNEALVRPAMLIICVFILSYAFANKFYQARM